MLTIRRKGDGDWYYIRGTVKVGKKSRYVAEHATGCRERQVAENYRINLEREIQQELLHGSAGRSHGLTVADALMLYLDRPEGLHKMDIWRVGELNHTLGDYALADVADGWSVFKADRCKGLAPATVERFRATLQAALNYAAADRGIDAPKLAKVRFKNEIIRWLSVAERDRLLAAYAPHVRPIMLTLAYQGCRTQEALQLRWEHVDMGAGRMYFVRTKNGEPRMIKMHPLVFAAVEALWKTRKRPVAGHVFLNRLGKPYGDTRDYKLPGGNPLRKAHETACKRAGIEGFRIHDWRHHWASWAVMNGVDLLTIKKLGGWKSLRMVERYAALSTEHMDAAILKIA